MSPLSTAPTILCYDIGLTNVKAVLIADDGTVIGLASRWYPTRFGPDAQAEQEPDDWWRAMCAATKELAGLVGPAWTTIAAVAVTAHMHGLVGLDHAGRPVGPALILGDLRATEDADAISTILGESVIHAITGSTMDPTMPAAKIRWLSRHQPERFERIATFTSVKDQVRGRLVGGDRWTDPIDACATALWDIHRREWSAEILDRVGIDVARLPEVVPATSLTRSLGPAAARFLGLPIGLPVIVGAGDDIEVVGCGLVRPGSAIEHVGTTGSILKVIAEPVHDPALALELYPHAIEGLWVTGGSITAAGAAIEWASSLLGNGEETVITRGGLRVDDPIFLPGLAGERCPARNPRARGGWLGLSLGSSTETLLGSVNEGVVFALRRIIDAIVDVTGSIDRLVVSAGGGAAVPRAVQRRADLYGRSLTLLATPEPTALGLAAVVAVGIGAHDDLLTAVAAMVPEGRPAEPDHATAVVNEARYARFCRAAAALDPIW